MKLADLQLGSTIGDYILVDFQHLRVKRNTRTFLMLRCETCDTHRLERWSVVAAYLCAIPQRYLVCRTCVPDLKPGPPKLGEPSNPRPAYRRAAQRVSS